MHLFWKTEVVIWAVDMATKVVNNVFFLFMNEVITASQVQIIRCRWQAIFSCR